MNARIKELADQVGLGTQHNGIVLTKNVNAAEAFEQFALLIVRECADQVKDFYQEDEFTCYSAAETIKEHFGVES